MIVAIHQPNFFPWLGYFNKIARADVMCLLDNVQFPKKGGTWINRVRILVNGAPTWATAPVDRRFSGMRQIHEMSTSTEPEWRAKLLRTLSLAYRNARHFDSVWPRIEELVSYPTDCLADYNENAIRKLCESLNLDDTRLVRGSTLAVSGNATDLLISIVTAVGGHTYLCGGGAAGYQEDEKFAQAGIRLEYQHFSSPTYDQQLEQFQPGLSILDALAHCGFAETERMIREA